MGKTYNLDPGYVTVPEANEIVMRILTEVYRHEDEQSHYKKILTLAKKGSLGGKKYGKRMYQVRKENIIEYAKDYNSQKLRLEKGFQLELALVDDFEKLDKFPPLENETAKKLKQCLNYLWLNQIITDEALRKAEKDIILRMNMGAVRKVL